MPTTNRYPTRRTNIHSLSTNLGPTGCYDLSNGAEVWRSRQSAGGQATPMSNLGADGRQYVLVVAGGHGCLGTKAGDLVLAYALPANSGTR